MEDKITISLRKEQRDLLLKYEQSFSDKDLFRLISIAVKKGNNYEICLDEEQMDDLCDQLYDLSESEENEEQVGRLDDLCDHLEDCRDEYNGYGEDDEDDDYSEFSDNTGAVCILKVVLADENEIWRKIAIREGQTLHDLHNIIFDAFDRDDEHLYSFFLPHLPQKKLNIRKIHQDSDEYTHPYACEDPGPFSSGGKDASVTSVKSLNLTEGQIFYYLFDFGDEWWHEIIVEQADGQADDGDYPRIIEKKGDSPEQYDYPEDEED